MLPSTDKAFDGSEFAKAINDTIQKASVRQDIPTLSGDHSPVYSASKDCTEIHHHISATETLFGTVWLRTSTVRVSHNSKSSKGRHLVSTFVYYPS